MGIHDDLRNIARRQRVYAPLREGGTKGQKELGVLADFLASMRDSGQQLYSHPELSANDPPDCVARTSAGGVAAFEIIEFVSQPAVERNEKARPERGERPNVQEMAMAKWSKNDFVEHMTTLLRTKDEKIYRGGPYSECVVLVHTDEPLLIRAEAEEWLAKTVFGPYGQLTASYMIYSYEPAVGYPFQALRLRSSA